MMRLSFALAIAFSSILLAGSATADPPPTAPPPPSYAPPPNYWQPYPYPPPPPPREVRRPYSTPMMITGIVISAVGSIALGLGTAMYVINDSIVCAVDDFGGGGGCGPSHGGDTAVMVAGGIASLAGIPFIAVGAHGDPVKPNTTALVPTISVSPRGASLTFSF